MRSNPRSVSLEQEDVVASGAGKLELLGTEA